MFKHGPTGTVTLATLLFAAKFGGVTNPPALSAELPLQIPPGGLVTMVKGAALLQKGGTAVMVGVIVLVTETLSTVFEGHTVGLGLENVL